VSPFEGKVGVINDLYKELEKELSLIQGIEWIPLYDEKESQQSVA
jgi:hypothetical protein